MTIAYPVGSTRRAHGETVTVIERVQSHRDLHRAEVFGATTWWDQDAWVIAFAEGDPLADRYRKVAPR